MSADYLSELQRGIDFAESMLDEDLALADVARAGHLSQWHFQRIFRSLTGETLKGYIRSRRLARSLDRLLEDRLRIIDIAVLAGFESQESYARAFKKEFGVTPSDYRRIGSRSRFLHKLELDQDALAHLHRRVSLEPVLREQPGLQLVGMRTHYYGADSAKNNLSSRLPALWAQFVPRAGEVPHHVPGCLYGVITQTAADTDLLEYHAAVAVERFATVPEGMVALEVPPACYATFEHRGAATELDRTVSYAYSTWLLRSGRRHTSGPDVEMYDQRYKAESADSVITYALPVTRT